MASNNALRAPGRAMPTLPQTAPRRSPSSEPTSQPRPKRPKLAHLSKEAEQDAAHDEEITLQRHNSYGSGSTESAGNWFEIFNKNVESGQTRSPNTSDEPPFYLSSSLAPISNNFVSRGGEQLYGANYQESDDNENDELRGVIDDLTVENRRLKMVLKSRRVRQGPKVANQDRLFDLRVHGLPAEKKRELEQLLHNFATTIDTSAIPSSSTTKGSDNPGSESLGGIPHNQLNFLHADSGYGSNSSSGLTPATVSRGGKSNISISRTSRNKNIETYLHDIPNTLLPHQPPFMTERARMALVVRRLEQLFTGKVATTSEHSQPRQQQEVSHSAARPDTFPVHTRKPEGSREANMLPPGTKVNLDAVTLEPSPPQKDLKSRAEQSGTSTPSRLGSPQQRPTRPLDLDIQRAQIADENVEYLRHLGLPSSDDISAGSPQEHPWIYLNLLISMAQLHTINVTPAFIRRAIRKMSTTFELSNDGHKVRWKGGTEGSIFSTTKECVMEATHQSVELADDTGHGNSRRSKAGSSSHVLISEEPSSGDMTNGLKTSITPRQQASTSATCDLQAPAPLQLTKSRCSFDYQPIFFKSKNYSPQHSYLDSTASSYSSGDSNAPVHASSKSDMGRQSSDEGTITFYKNPFFCSDASADSAPINWKPMKQVLPWETLGADREAIGESPLRHHDACYFTPQFAAKSYIAAADEPLLSFPQSKISSSGKDETHPMVLPASGIGGVYPEDNFALDVKTAKNNLPVPELSPKRVPFTGTQKRNRYAYCVESCERLDLQPSKLPPPTYIFFSSGSSGNYSAIDDSEVSDSSSSADEDYPAPAAFLNRWSTGSSDDSEEDQDSSSIDMLAMARAAHPDRIAEAERAFMMPDVNPAGEMEDSLIATVGTSRSSSEKGDVGSDVDAEATDVDVDDDE